MCQEIRVWGEGKAGLWRPEGPPVDIPRNFDEITPGDAFVTRKVKKLSETVFLRMAKAKSKAAVRGRGHSGSAEDYHQSASRGRGD